MHTHTLSLTHTHVLTHTHTPSLTHTHSPKSDTCNTCDSMKVNCDAESDPTVKAKLVAEWELHKRKAKRAYQVLKDSARAKSDPNVDVICFDLQAVPTPLLSTNVVFYKRCGVITWGCMIVT